MSDKYVQVTLGFVQYKHFQVVYLGTLLCNVDGAICEFSTRLFDAYMLHIRGSHLSYVIPVNVVLFHTVVPLSSLSACSLHFSLPFFCLCMRKLRFQDLIFLMCPQYFVLILFIYKLAACYLSPVAKSVLVGAHVLALMYKFE